MKGEFVVVRDYASSGIVCRVFETSDSRVFIMSDEEYSKRVSGLQSADPIGLRWTDVFAYDEAARIALSTGRDIEWSKLSRYTAPALSAGNERGVKMKPTLNVALIAKEAAIKAAEYVSADIMAADDAYDYGAVYPMDAAIANDVYVRAAQAAYETYVKAICDANVARVAQAREVQDAIAKEKEQG